MKTRKKTLQVGTDGKMESVPDSKQIENSKPKQPELDDDNKIYNPRTIQRAKLRTVARFLNPLAAMMNFLYKKAPRRFSGINKVLNANFLTVLSGEYPKLKIDYSKVIISKGDLKLPPCLSASSPEPGAIVFAWTDDSGIEMTRADDQAYVAVYCPELKLWATQLDVANRKDRTCTMYAHKFAGKKVEPYIGFVSWDLKRTSNSVYTGRLTIL